MVVLARQHEQFSDLSTSDLLRLSMRVNVEDRNVARVLWRRASKIGLGDDEVTSALELGYKLSLDHELRPLVGRLSALATEPDGHVRQMTLHDAREILTARRNDIDRVYQTYRAGDIPVHVCAQHLGRPLVFAYRRAPLLIKNLVAV